MSLRYAAKICYRISASVSLEEKCIFTSIYVFSLIYKIYKEKMPASNR